MSAARPHARTGKPAGCGPSQPTAKQQQLRWDAASAALQLQPLLLLVVVQLLKMRCVPGLLLVLRRRRYRR